MACSRTQNASNRKGPNLGLLTLSLVFTPLFTPQPLVLYCGTLRSPYTWNAQIRWTCHLSAKSEFNLSLFYDTWSVDEVTKVQRKQIACPRFPAVPGAEKFLEVLNSQVWACFSWIPMCVPTRQQGKQCGSKENQIKEIQYTPCFLLTGYVEPSGLGQRLLTQKWGYWRECQRFAGIGQEKFKKKSHNLG